MPALFLTLRLFYVRALLLVSVLASLCISEGVGLQLLPIPGAADLRPGLPEARADEARTDVPSLPAQGKSISGRTEIVAPKLKGFSPPPSIPLMAAALLAAEGFPFSSPAPAFSKQPVSGYSLTFVAQGASRAPPVPA